MILSKNCPSASSQRERQKLKHWGDGKYREASVNTIVEPQHSQGKEGFFKVLNFAVIYLTVSPPE